jgi:4-hydroxy-3-polyprenylbenzoate decarboxylase
MQPLYKGHAKQFMHAFWGAGQMSFVKHAIFLDEKAPNLESYEAVSAYILDRFTPKSLYITDGILDALDHSSPETLVGGKLGIDATAANKVEAPNLLGDEELLQKIQELIPDVFTLHQFMRRTKNPITVIAVQKTKNAKNYFDALLPLSMHLRVVVFVDAFKNDIHNAYMLLWRVTNNMDAMRDVFVSGLMVGVDGTNKNALDGFERRWPDDVDCTPSVVESLKSKGVWDLSENLYQKFQLT